LVAGHGDRLGQRCIASFVAMKVHGEGPLQFPKEGDERIRLLRIIAF
jgi:hypothetical protein